MKRSLEIAKRKLERLRLMDNVRFYKAILDDKDFIVGMYILPYYVPLDPHKDYGENSYLYVPWINDIAKSRKELVNLEKLP